MIESAFYRCGGSPVEAYLRSRGYTGIIPPTNLAPSRAGHHAAMIAAFALVGEIEPGVLGEPSHVEAIHLTLLRPDGASKAVTSPNKLCVGSPAGQPITLSPPNDLLGMAFTEGIEDGLTAYAATGLGVWLVITHRGHAWLLGDRFLAIREKKWLEDQWRGQP
jgi:hypothetical protein